MKQFRKGFESEPKGVKVVFGRKRVVVEKRGHYRRCATDDAASEHTSNDNAMTRHRSSDSALDA